MHCGAWGKRETVVNPKIVLAALLCLALLARFAAPEASGQEIPTQNENDRYDFYAAKFDAEQALVIGHQTVPEQVIARLESLRTELEETPYTDLTVNCRMLLHLAGERAEAAEELRRMQKLSDSLNSAERAMKREKNLKSAGIVTLGISVVCIGLFNLFWFLADDSYEQYNDATNLADAEKYQKTTEQYEALSYIFGAVGAGSMAVSIPLMVNRPPRREPVKLEKR
jgi:hypothetical protein